MIDPNKAIEVLTAELTSFVKNTGMTRAVVGLSGGVDSAVTLALAVRALGAEQVTAVLLPQTGLSSDESRNLAMQLADQLDVATETVEIGAAVDALRQAMPWSFDKLRMTQDADINIAPRLRMTALYHFARSHDALVLGTSNRSECLLGYGTKWGDFAADVEVIGSLFKTEVYALAAALDISQTIIDRPPTAELATGVTDESELGASYAVLDPILQQLADDDFLPSDGMDELTQQVYHRVIANRHKTQPPPILGIVA